MAAEQVVNAVVVIVVIQIAKVIPINIIPAQTVIHVNIIAQDVPENVEEHVPVHVMAVHIL